MQRAAPYSTSEFLKDKMRITVGPLCIKLKKQKYERNCLLLYIIYYQLSGHIDLNVIHCIVIMTKVTNQPLNKSD